MTSSLANYPISNVTPTGAFNIVEIYKFLRIIFVWMVLIFTPVWLAAWAIGELIPFIIVKLSGNEVPVAGVYTIQALQAIVPLICVMVFIPINAMFMVLCERRGLALFTVRKGPNRVGPDGMAQTAADAVKLLFKEDITPEGADIAMFTLAPIIFFAPSIFGAIPLLAAITNNHPLFMVTNLPSGIFFVLAMSSIPVVALVMGGWSSNNKYSLVGGLRAAAQAISYEIPLVLSLITICYLNGTLDLVQIAGMQTANTPQDYQMVQILQATPPDQVWTGGMPADKVPLSPGIFRWNLFANGVLQFDVMNPSGFFANLSGWYVLSSILLIGCCWLLLGIYLTSACAEINRIPFDLPEAESELVSGYNTEYSGIKFAIFFLAEFTNLFIVATIATVMFLGGGSAPAPWFLDAHFFAVIFNAIGGVLKNIGIVSGTDAAWILGSLLNPITFSGWLWVVIKVYSIVLFAILVRGTLPRFRIDQLMDFGWKRLIPLTLILFLAVAFLKEAVRP